MAATADPNEVIQLPKMRPGDLSTLMVELASTARGTTTQLADAAKHAKKKPTDEASALPEAVPARVLEALDDMDAARPALVAALRTEPSADGLTPEQRAFDDKMNATWRCVKLTYELGEQRANMAGDARLAERCRQGRTRVLPKGIAFISLVGRPEYAVSEVCLGTLETEQSAFFKELPGGAGLLRDARAVHDGYGRAFHITVAAPEARTESAGVALAATEASAATREYIAAVVGSVRRTDPRTRALAEKLLAPLANYGRPSAPSADAGRSDPTPPVTPVDPNT